MNNYLSILLGTLYVLMSLGLFLLVADKAMASQATTQPAERTQVRPQPVSLITVPPANCVDDCIRWEDYPGTRTKLVCFLKTFKGRKVVKRFKGGKIIISNIRAKRICREAIV